MKLLLLYVAMVPLKHQKHVMTGVLVMEMGVVPYVSEKVDDKVVQVNQQIVIGIPYLLLP
jgi:hypothetical protein